jgi:hypothetical protein
MKYKGKWFVVWQEINNYCDELLRTQNYREAVNEYKLYPGLRFIEIYEDCVFIGQRSPKLRVK